MKGRQPRPALERFEEKIERITESGCWLWTHGLSSQKVAKDSYGVFRLTKEKGEKAHRAAWMLFKGEIPDGMLVCHRCDIPSCVNPAHLFLGTNAENMADMKAKGRAKGRKGESHPSAKLNEEKVVAMRKLFEAGMTSYELAPIFGVSKSLVHVVVSRQNWKHVP